MTPADGVLTIAPVTIQRWRHLVELFGDNGGYSNCWCTWWLLSSAEWNRATPAERRARLEAEVAADLPPGLLGYVDEAPAAWCAVSPRRRYERLMSPRARVFKTIDEEETWVVNCFFVRREMRGRGLARALLDAAVDHTRKNGGTILEAYPRDDRRDSPSSAELFVGSLTMFESAGFREVARVNERPLVRLSLGAGSQ